MKKFTKLSFVLAGLVLVNLNVQGQSIKIKMEEIAAKKQNAAALPKQIPTLTEGFTVVKQPAQKAAVLTNCTDKINFPGNTVGTSYLGLGSNTLTNNPWEVGTFQVYPDYSGEVTEVEFTASRYNTGGPAPKVYVAIYDLNGTSPDVFAQYPPSAPFVTITNTNPTDWTYTFATPITVSGGFAVGLFTLGQDSAKIHTGPILANVAPFYSFVYNSLGNMYTFSNYFNVDVNVMAKPTVKTSVNPTWLTAKTSTGCGVPAVYNFTNTTSPFPSYIGHSVINPGGMTRTLDYGDGSALVNNFTGMPLTHSYTTIGNYIADFTQTYVGWTSNCVESLTTSVVVDNPLPSFTYNTNGLTVTFNNTSQNLSSYNWNFGDLGTSNQTNPTHTFSSPGTYVVELEGTAPCGKVTFIQTIVVSSATGISKNSNDNSLITLYPNPASNTLKINNTSKTELNSKIEIFNSVGASVKTIHNTDLMSGSTSVDVSDLSKGIYFIKLKNKNGDVIKSFVKE